MISGIYKITNKLNNNLYVGASSDIENRWRNHKLSLQDNSHHNFRLQREWNRYGEENFEFKIIDKCSVNEFQEKEQYYFDLLEPQYNSRMKADSSKKYIVSEETRKKLQSHEPWNKGKKMTEEQKSHGLGKRGKSKKSLLK